ncbi:hypothetical protein Sjap_023333 [Stephania japonica]|uniref:MADS-box domain-containing protein n=1 Tax=Stephania japonica TaxID=461633 RepID=A0AAP0EBE3_9MAGN
MGRKKIEIKPIEEKGKHQVTFSKHRKGLFNKGRKKIEIKPIEEKGKRQVTFSKRRKGLFNKANEMCMIEDTAKMSVVVFSPAGKPFSFHHPSAVDTAIDHFLNGWNPSDSSHTAPQSMDSKEGFWGDKVNLDQLQTVEELTMFEDELKSLKNIATARLHEIELQRNHEASTSSSLLLYSVLLKDEWWRMRRSMPFSGFMIPLRFLIFEFPIELPLFFLLK